MNDIENSFRGLYVVVACFFNSSVRDDVEHAICLNLKLSFCLSVTPVGATVPCNTGSAAVSGARYVLSVTQTDIPFLSAKHSDSG